MSRAFIEEDTVALGREHTAFTALRAQSARVPGSKLAHQDEGVLDLVRGAIFRPNSLSSIRDRQNRLLAEVG
jgi:hypothetical protein